MNPNEPFDSESEATAAAPSCPKCHGPMWDNRASKRNPKAPDFKCKDKSCDGVIWPPRGAAAAARDGSTRSYAPPAAQPARPAAPPPPPPFDDSPPPDDRDAPFFEEDDDLPF